MSLERRVEQVILVDIASCIAQQYYVVYREKCAEFITENYREIL